MKVGGGVNTADMGFVSRQVPSGWVVDPAMVLVAAARFLRWCLVTAAGGWCSALEGT